METFKRVAREIEQQRAKAGLNSLNSLNSQAGASDKSRGRGREKSEISEISDNPPPARSRDKSEKSEISPYAVTFAALEGRCPNYVDHARWQQCVADARQFLAQWGQQAYDLGWTVRDLFGLHTPLSIRARITADCLVATIRGCFGSSAATE
jgi:hypothetical protein